MMTQSIIDEHENWWLANEPHLLDKLTHDLAKQFDVVPPTDVLLGECLKFLHLAGKVNQYSNTLREKFTPSIIVDETWHCLILHTRSYHRFCQQFYGGFIHHNPGGDDAQNHKQLQTTLYALQQQFGKLNSQI